MTPAEPGIAEFDALVQRCFWLVGAVEGNLPHVTTGYRQYVPWKKGYPFGCPPGRYPNGKIRGDGRHRGIDLGGPGEEFMGALVYSWGDAVVRFVSYDPGGYFTFVGFYYLSVDKSVDYGHLLEGSVTVKAGDRVKAGQPIGRIGTRREGLGHSHVHGRTASGNFGASSIGPCQDENPIITWRALGLPG